MFPGCVFSLLNLFEIAVKRILVLLHYKAQLKRKTAQGAVPSQEQRGRLYPIFNLPLAVSSPGIGVPRRVAASGLRVSVSASALFALCCEFLQLRIACTRLTLLLVEVHDLCLRTAQFLAQRIDRL